MAQGTVMYFDVVVTTSGKVYCQGEDLKEGKITIVNSAAALGFILKPEDTTRPTAFATFPFQWIDAEGQPLPNTPPPLTTIRYDSQRAAILDANVFDDVMHFHVMVYQDGHILSDVDPTIINVRLPTG